jgi:hypothetical protein
MNEKKKRIEKLEKRIIRPKSVIWVTCTFRAGSTEEEKAEARQQGIKRWEEAHGQEINTERVSFLEIEIYGGSLAVEQAR